MLPFRADAANALLLARGGLRIGELVDLELDCVHEVPGQGAWLRCRSASSTARWVADESAAQAGAARPTGRNEAAWKRGGPKALFEVLMAAGRPMSVGEAQVAAEALLGHGVRGIRSIAAFRPASVVCGRASSESGRVANSYTVK